MGMPTGSRGIPTRELHISLTTAGRWDHVYSTIPQHFSRSKMVFIRSTSALWNDSGSSSLSEDNDKPTTIGGQLRGCIPMTLNTKYEGTLSVLSHSRMVELQNRMALQFSLAVYLGRP